jgi:hypothetical protein
MSADLQHLLDAYADALTGFQELGRRLLAELNIAP